MEGAGKRDCLYEGRHTAQRHTFKQDNRQQIRFATPVLSWDNFIIIRLGFNAGDGSGAVVKTEITGGHGSQDRGERERESTSPEHDVRIKY